ncbi:MAG TPA: hypothetical protein VHH36_07530, partial [Candidatus Thermoplasmatota archaeon]|nr:hypothetical protein [Candidatus Thermoplasmatota archaeon]
MRPLAPLALLLTATAALASAGAPDAPEIADPAGDASGQAWADLTGAWWHDETQETVSLTVRVAATSPRPPDTVVEVLFRVGSQWFIAGDAHFVSPPATVTDTGFLCPTDEAGFPTGDCTDLATTETATTYTV